MEKDAWTNVCSDGNLERERVGGESVVKEGGEVRLEERERDESEL